MFSSPLSTNEPRVKHAPYALCLTAPSLQATDAGRQPPPRTHGTFCIISSHPSGTEKRRTYAEQEVYGRPTRLARSFHIRGRSSERMTRWGPRPPRRAVSTVFRPRHRFGKALCITPPSGAELGGFLACAVVCLYAVPHRAVVQYLPGVLPAFPVHADIHMETGGKFRMGRNVHRLEIKGASGACPESPACAYGLLWNSSSSRHESGLC